MSKEYRTFHSLFSLWNRSYRFTFRILRPHCTTWKRRNNHEILLLYLPTQIRFLIGGERVTCHWSKLHDALGQQQLELSTHTWSGRAPLKRRQIFTPADVKQIIFICVLFYFELGGITKHLMTGPSGNSEFCFPSTSMFPSASPRGTLRVSGKQNSLFPLGPVIKCLMIEQSYTLRWRFRWRRRRRS